MRKPIQVRINIEYYHPYLKTGEVKGDEKVEYEIVAKDEEELSKLVKEIAEGYYKLTERV